MKEMIIAAKVENINDVCAPLFFRLNKFQDTEELEHLKKSDHAITVHDEIEGQLRELIKINNPSVKIKAGDYPELIAEHLSGQSMFDYGVWVYYQWSKRLVHILDKQEFVEVRTNRNRYKITGEEQRLLSKKKIGIVGLSVGQSIALTLAIERTCGELRLADFDRVELSNLNRIRTGLHNLGLEKTIMVAREISEIDPYLKVKVFKEGINEKNIDEFFSSGGLLDLLVEVCDGLDVKILSRFKARELKVPVIMDTNDRGMLDVERYDLEPERPILHGLAGDLDPKKITHLTNEEKIPYILMMIGADTISTRLKASMLEVEQSINTWPQLASSVTLGGAITTDVCRNIFLDQFHDSGRYYIDIDKIIKDRDIPLVESHKQKYTGPAKLTLKDLEDMAQRYPLKNTSRCNITDNIQEIIEAACLAPSGGNSQPWKFLFQNNSLYIFHDAYYSYSLLDFNNLGSYIAFGAMLENIELKASSLGLLAKPDIFPLTDDLRLIAVVSFTQNNIASKFIYLAPLIGTRMTNRNTAERKLLNDIDKSSLTSIASTISNARLQLFEAEKYLNEFAEILTNTERLRFLHPRGHYDTFVNELRFTKEEVESTSDGLDIGTLNMRQSEIAALQIAKDPSAIAFLHQLQKGSGFKKISRKNILTASSIGVISMNGHDTINFLEGGRAVERIWLEANYRGISFQPISQIIFMTELFLSGTKADLNYYERNELKDIHERFAKIIKLEQGRFPVFVFRVCYAEACDVRSLRRPLDEVFYQV